MKVKRKRTEDTCRPRQGTLGQVQTPRQETGANDDPPPSCPPITLRPPPLSPLAAPRTQAWPTVWDILSALLGSLSGSSLEASLTPHLQSTSFHSTLRPVLLCGTGQAGHPVRAACGVSSAQRDRLPDGTSHNSAQTQRHCRTNERT